MNPSSLLEKLKAEVFGRQKVLARVYRDHKGESLSDYADHWKVIKEDKTGARAEVLDILKRMTQENYRTKIAAGSDIQLRQSLLVSTVDHHGILNHPFFLNSNLIFGLRQKQEYLICLSTAGVSLNNSSWPASLVVTDKSSGKLKRFSLFPDRLKTTTVLAAPAWQEHNVKIVLERIKEDGSLNQNEKQKLGRLVAEAFLSQDILSLPSFSKQASLASTVLWSRIFPQAPKVLYLPVEELVSRLVIEQIGKDPDHVLFQLLFTSPGHELVEKHFQGSLGAFSSGHKGSFLFWGINKKGRRVHLQRQGNKLVDGDYSVLLDPIAISQALLEGRVYPTSLVCFLMLLYYQITCLGGFNQVNWLTDIKEKFSRLLLEMKEREMAEKISQVPTDNFAEGNIAFLLQNGKLTKATGMDIYLADNDHPYKKYCQLAQKLTVGESIESLLPEIYRVIVPAFKRNADLLSLTDEEIVKYNGTEQKILGSFA